MNRLLVWVDAIACWLLPRRSLSRLALRYVRLRAASAKAPADSSGGVTSICLFAARGEVDNPHVPGMGDVICRNAFLKILAERYPGARISVVAGPRFLDKFRTLLLEHMYAQELIACPEIGEGSFRSWIAFLRRMQPRHFDLCLVDPDSVTVRAPHAVLCGVPQRMGIPKIAGEASFLTTTVSIQNTRGPVPDLLDISRGWAVALGVPMAVAIEDFTPRFPYRPDSRARLDLPQPIVAVHVGGGKNWNRRWPLEKYTELCLRLCSDAGASIVLVGGADDATESACVHAAVTGRHPGANIRNLTGNTLNDLANYLVQTTVFIGNDSAPMHVAAAVGTPVIVLSGPVYTYLWDRLYAVQRLHAGFDCGLSDAAPRRHEMRRINCQTFHCPYAFDAERPSYPVCMMAIPVDEVCNAAMAHWPRQVLA